MRDPRISGVDKLAGHSKLNFRAKSAQLLGATVLCGFILDPNCARSQETGPQDATELGDAMAAPEKADDWLPGEVSGSVALTSNYVDRGITNSANNSAIQGSLEYAVDTGMFDTQAYIGMWSSSVDIEGDRSTAHLEIDALFGVRGNLGDLSWDVGGAYYVYPGTRNNDNFNYWEIPVVFDYAATDCLKLELVNLFAWDNQFDTGLANYTTANAYFDIPVRYVGLQVFGGVGYQYVEKDYNGVDWRLGIKTTVKGVDFSVAYTDTTYHSSECGNNQCNPKVIFTVGAELNERLRRGLGQVKAWEQGCRL